MIIAIDLTSLSYHMTGIERYAACVTEKMLEQDEKNEYILIFRNEIYPALNRFVDGKRVRAEILHGDRKVVFLQIILPIHLYRIKADKYLFFAFVSPLLFEKKGIYNTIHDMGAWDASEAMTILQKIYWRITMKWASKVSEGIITVSEFSKGRIQQILSYPLGQIHVVYSAVYEGVTKNYGYSFEDIRKKYDLPARYIMTLSTLEPRKNMTLLLDAFSQIKDQVDYDLVLVGRKGWKMDDELERYDLKNRIHITGFVDDKHISVIYEHALCFVFTSLYEGFGLPPVEALALGTPVISSDAASLPEVLRRQAMYFKNKDKDALQDLLSNLDDVVLRIPHELDAFQKQNYRFDVSAKKILDIIS